MRRPTNAPRPPQEGQDDSPGDLIVQFRPGYGPKSPPINHFSQEQHLQFRPLFPNEEAEVEREDPVEWGLATWPGAAQEEAQVAQTNLTDTEDPYALSNFYTVHYDPQAGRTAEEWLERLRRLEGVVTAYIDPPTLDAGRAGAAALTQLDYRGAAGINSAAAQGRPGSQGEGIRIIDLENGWALQHPALADRTISIVYPTPPTNCSESVFHGTAVLNILCARPHPADPAGHYPAYTGMARGLVPQVESINVASCCNLHMGEDQRRATIIRNAARRLRPGDVLLLEVQTWSVEHPRYLAPVELWPADYAAIHYATRRRGVIVIEAAGNGGHPLDETTDRSGNLVLNRRVRDSGAILVGAARPDPATPERVPHSNFGSRVDCCAWGDGVITSTWDIANNTSFEPFTFDETSAASALIAGVAVLVQSLTKHDPRWGQAWTPTSLRAILSAPAHGVAVGTVEKIGVMPNVGSIIADILP